MKVQHTYAHRTIYYTGCAYVRARSIQTSDMINTTVHVYLIFLAYICLCPTAIGTTYTCCAIRLETTHIYRNEKYVYI
jgi:hypothetical protein